MNDPWDVKSRQMGQYVSCMRLNGVPLLPPLLSKECRKEMQYYKLLAKEVEKRISDLKAYILDSEEVSSQDLTDATELPQEYEQPCEPQLELLQEHETNTMCKTEMLAKSVSDCVNTNIDLSNSVTTNSVSHSHPKFSDDSLASLQNSQTIEVPERDCDITPKKINKVDAGGSLKTPARELIDLFTVQIDLSNVEPPTTGCPDMVDDGPQSLSSRSFTGSLNNVHSESVRDASTLARTGSYTVLNPSPMLIAHLKVQSLNTGVDVTSISMSESLSNLTPKKRRGWDLESAKVKWSSMAHELQQRSVAKSKPIENKNTSKPIVKKPHQTPPRSKSVQERPRHPSLPGKTPKSEPLQKHKKFTPSPYANTNSASVKEPTPTSNVQKPSPKKLVSECEDPATKVKELYDKIQNQQLLQMASLVEKQKQEQMLLQQVFNEQNSILYRQLKTICPKSPIEAKAAWADKVDRGPVSLSQLINHQSPNSLTNTLTDTHNNLDKCAEILKKSKDITGSIKKQTHSSVDTSLTHTNSPKRTRTSRKLSYECYDTSSSDREFEPILTDRTNDTMAGLNITFTSDSDDPTFLEKRASSESRVRSMGSQHRMPARKPMPVRLPPTPEQLAAASTIVAYAKGYLVRRLLRTERVQATVQTIRDALLCALQMHQDRAGIRGADVDLHRRLIQQITAACYSLHDTFVASTPAERCALIAADRERRRQKPLHLRQSDIMSQSHSGAFPARVPRSGSNSLMTQSHYGNSH